MNYFAYNFRIVLKRLAIVVILAIIPPIYGQQNNAQTGGHKPDGKNTHWTVPCMVKQDATAPECAWTEAKPDSYFQRLFSPENAPNIGLFFVGLFGVAAAVCTLRAIRQQANLMETQAVQMALQLEQMEKVSEVENKTLILQYRPRVIVRNATAKAFSKEIAEGVFSEPVRCVVAFQMVNIGGSPARIVDGDIYLLSARSGGLEEEIEFKESTHVGIGQRILQPGERETIEFALDTRISNDARWVEFYKGASSHRIFLLGTIWYRDDLEIPRQTGLNRSYDPKTKTFVPRKDSEEEYSD